MYDSLLILWNKCQIKPKSILSTTTLSICTWKAINLNVLINLFCAILSWSIWVITSTYESYLCGRDVFNHYYVSSKLTSTSTFMFKWFKNTFMLWSCHEREIVVYVRYKLCCAEQIEVSVGVLLRLYILSQIQSISLGLMKICEHFYHILVSQYRIKLYIFAWKYLFYFLTWDVD